MSDPDFDLTPSSHADTILLPPPSKTLGARCQALSDTGRVREGNEDHFLVAELAQALRVYQSSSPQPRTQYSGERSYLLAVADGMGGYEAGELASALALETAAACLLDHVRPPKRESSNIPVELAAAFYKADDRIFEEVGRCPERRGMGTTLTLALTVGKQLHLAHAGDSRAYLLRTGQLQQLTVDHTVVRAMVQQGIIRADEAAEHRYRHVLTNVIGGPDEGVRVELSQHNLQAGDVLLLCTDGLTEMIDDGRIREILSESHDPELACRLLVEAAIQNGGEDNVTALVAQFDHVTEPQPPADETP